MDATGVVGHVGRKGLRLALTDQQGCVLPGSIRVYGPDQGSSLSGGLSAFQRELALPRLPRRLAIAVAGLARGDAISVTHTRWFVSRSGLQAMLGQPPLILNDFEAEAWALAGDSGTFVSLGSSPAVTVHQPGTYCVLGMTSGLGVSVLTRNLTGDVHVLATEAGHAGFAPASRSMADLVGRMFPDRHPVVAEHLISAPGLVAIHSALAATRGLRHVMTKPEDITRAANSDPLAREACALLCEAFWSHVDSLILTYGAWDGVIVTGGLAHALRATLSAPRKQYLSPDNSRYIRQLAAVPRTLVELEHGELLGAAQALQRLPN